MGELLGYARVSTTEQDAKLQHDALSAAGCWRTWTDTASGVKTNRPQLAEVLASLRPGDTLVVWRLDRLGRSLPHLIDTVRGLKDRAVGFRSLTEAIDTTTPGGRLVFHIFASLAQFAGAHPRANSGRGSPRPASVGASVDARRSSPRPRSGRPGECSPRAPPRRRWRAWSGSASPRCTGG